MSTIKRISKKSIYSCMYAHFQMIYTTQFSSLRISPPGKIPSCRASFDQPIAWGIDPSMPRHPSIFPSTGVTRAIISDKAAVDIIVRDQLHGASCPAITYVYPLSSGVSFQKPGIGELIPGNLPTSPDVVCSGIPGLFFCSSSLPFFLIMPPPYSNTIRSSFKITHLLVLHYHSLPV